MAVTNAESMGQKEAVVTQVLMLGGEGGVVTAAMMEQLAVMTASMGGEAGVVMPQLTDGGQAMATPVIRSGEEAVVDGEAASVIHQMNGDEVVAPEVADVRRFE